MARGSRQPGVGFGYPFADSENSGTSDAEVNLLISSEDTPGYISALNDDRDSDEDYLEL